MNALPFSLSLFFALVTAAAVGLFYVAARRSARTLGLLLAWLALQAGLGMGGFYTVTTAWPPRLLLLLGPPLLLTVGLFVVPAGRRYLDQLRPDQLTLLHTVRVPVELVLWALYLHRAVPQLMTFEGRNFDLLAGLSAPLVYWLAFRRRQLGARSLLAWNVLSLGLLLNIAGNAVLAAPGPLQRQAFEQPNVAIQYFPYVWLPAVVVPLVLVAHLAVLRQLTRRQLT